MPACKSVLWNRCVFILRFPISLKKTPNNNIDSGFETVKLLASKSAKVYMGARSQTKAEVAINSIKKDNLKADVVFKTQENMLHGLILNAGIMCLPFELSKDGYENHWQVHTFQPLLALSEYEYIQ